MCCPTGDDGGVGSDFAVCNPGTDCNDCRRRNLLGWVGKTGVNSGYTTSGVHLHYIDGGTGEKAKGQGALSKCGFAYGCDMSNVDYTKCCETQGYSYNGVCDDEGPITDHSGSAHSPKGQSVVPYGWDFLDCGYRTSLRPILVDYACADSCGDPYIHNGVCNERLWWMKPGSTSNDVYACPYGTDCSDCGAKNSPVMTTPDHMGGAFDTCIDYITGVPQYRNGICELLPPPTARPRLSRSPALSCL